MKRCMPLHACSIVYTVQYAVSTSAQMPGPRRSHQPHWSPRSKTISIRPKRWPSFFALAKELNKATDEEQKQALAAAMFASGDLMGLLQTDPEEWFAGDADGEMPAEEVEELIAKRNATRAAKDFAAADGFRDQLAAAGIQIEDGPDGTTWKRGG